MEKNNFLKNNWFKFFLAFFAFTLIAGFLFFGNSGTAYAQDASALYPSFSRTYQASMGLPQNSPFCISLNPSTWVPCMLLAVLDFAGYLLSSAGTLFEWIVNVNNFNAVVNSSVTYAIWTNVRDVLNIAFIMMLLFSAFCTIFQVEKYSYKKILLNLVIMALLVNFSFPITRFIIDIANSMMYTFIQSLFPNNGITSALTDFTGKANLSAGLSPETMSWSGLIAAIVFVFILAVSLLAVGIMLVIRMVALALLIIFSPVAFVASILPDTSSYSGQWWSNLFKYAFFGPIMIFIIYISTRLMTLSQSSLLVGFVQIANKNSKDVNVVTTMAYLSIPIVLLWLGMGIAQSMSIAGASAVMGGAQKFLGWAGSTFSGYRAGRWAIKKGGEGAKYIATAGLKKFERDVIGKKYSPRAWVSAWKKRAQSTDEAFLGSAEGDARDKLNKLFHKDDITHYKEFEFEARVAKELKELQSISKDSKFYDDVVDRAKKMKTPQAQQRAVAAIRGLFEANDQNEYMKQHSLVNNPENLKNHLVSEMKATGMKDEEIARELYQLGEIALMKGNLANWGMADFDIKTGKYYINEDEAQREAALGKAQNIDVQQKMRTIHWNSLFEEYREIDSKTGKPISKAGKLHKTGEGILESINPAEIKQINRSRPDFIKRCSENIEKIEEYAKTSDNGANIREFIKEIRKFKESGGGTKKAEEFTRGAGI